MLSAWRTSMGRLELPSGLDISMDGTAYRAGKMKGLSFGIHMYEAWYCYAVNWAHALNEPLQFEDDEYAFLTDELGLLYDGDEEDM